MIWNMVQLDEVVFCLSISLKYVLKSYNLKGSIKLTDNHTYISGTLKKNIMDFYSLCCNRSLDP